MILLIMSCFALIFVPLGNLIIFYNPLKFCIEFRTQYLHLTQYYHSTLVNDIIVYHPAVKKKSVFYGHTSLITILKDGNWKVAGNTLIFKIIYLQDGNLHCRGLT